MKFEANPRLLDLLVGSNLYPEPEVCIRELVQNAWDAIEMRRHRGDGRGGRIHVSFDPAERWFEVTDDGIGMDERDIRLSFLSVGADKLEALGQAPAGEQVALFGIGVLSVFLVADSVSVTTRAADAEGALHFEVQNLHDEFEVTLVKKESIGTTIRVHIREDPPFDLASLPEITRRYVRHVPGVLLLNNSSGSQERLEETWDVAQFGEVDASPQAPQVRSGRTGFADALLSEGAAIGNRVTLSNVGFLVEERVLDLIPGNPSLGFGGELDLHSDALTIVMARERFQRDARWAALGSEVLHWFQYRALRALDTGHLRRGRGLDPPNVRRNLLIWLWATRDSAELEDLHLELRNRVFKTVPFSVAESSPTSLNRLVRRLPEPRLYVRRVDSPTQRARTIDDEGLPVQLTEEIRSSVRVGALRARGFPVLETSEVAAMTETKGGVSNLRIDEVEVIRDAVAQSRVEVLEFTAALEADMDLTGVETLPVLRSLLELPGGQLRFARIPDSQRRVISDPSGTRYLNVNSPTVQRLLRVIPRAVSNPLRRALLEIYLGIEEFNITEVRERLLTLLEDSNLSALGQGETAVLTSEALDRAVGQLLSELETAGA